MRVDQMFPSKYLKGTEIGQRVFNLTISKIEVENVGTEDKPEDKPVMYFTGGVKGLVLNRTNAAACEWLFGSETNDWVGKQIQMFAEPVMFRGEQKIGTRLRGVAAPTGAANVSTPPAADPFAAQEPVAAPVGMGPGEEAAQRAGAVVAPQAPGTARVMETHPDDLDDEIPF